MLIDIDARGLACPRPVILTKEKLAETNKPFNVLVDNEAARENVSRFAKSRGCDVEVSDHENCFLIKIIPPSSSSETMETTKSASLNETKKSTVIFIKTDELGTGDKRLSDTLMKSFLFACTEIDDPPEKIVLMNTGVRLATENEDTVEHLKALEQKGVEIICCGTCLDFYGLGEKLKVGKIGNMYEILSLLIAADKILSI